MANLTPSLGIHRSCPGSASLGLLTTQAVKMIQNVQLELWPRSLLEKPVLAALILRLPCLRGERQAPICAGWHFAAARCQLRGPARSDLFSGVLCWKAARPDFYIFLSLLMPVNFLAG